MKNTNARILVYDIETAPALGLFFGKPYDVNIAKIVQHEYVFGFSYKWLGEKKIYHHYIWDFPEYKLDKNPFNLGSNNSKRVIEKWAELVSQSQVVLGHNSDQFDYKHMHGRLALYKIPPIAWPQFIDTKKMAKQIGNYQSNKLDDLGAYFGTGRKLPHNDYPNAIDLWWDCMNDKAKAKKHMMKYNDIDVKRTEELYLTLMPYAKTHPNMALLTDQPDACARCGENKGFTSAGFKNTTTSRYRYWQCKNCFRKNPGRTREKIDRPDYV